MFCSAYDIRLKQTKAPLLTTVTLHHISPLAQEQHVDVWLKSFSEIHLTKGVCVCVSQGPRGSDGLAGERGGEGKKVSCALGCLIISPQTKQLGQVLIGSPLLPHAVLILSSSPPEISSPLLAAVCRALMDHQGRLVSLAMR